MKNNFFFIGFIIFGILFCNYPAAMAEEKILRIDVRHRPPEMVISGDSYSGPLIDIIKELSGKIGYTPVLKFRQFSGSMTFLKQGLIDILPRTICTQQRARSIDYLGPIGYQVKEIVFIVRKGQQNSINTFKDLEKFKIGSKKGTFYFDAFNNSTKIHKIETHDDVNLVKMFQYNRFDAFIALDQQSAENALKTNKIKDYAYANYSFTRHIGNYFGITKNHPARPALQKALIFMVKSGRIVFIYKNHGIEPPVFTDDMGFQACFALVP